MLASTGIWFVLNVAAPSLAGFAAAAIIAWLASPEDLGYAESARVVAQPVLVFAAGLNAVRASTHVVNQVKDVDWLIEAARALA